MHTIFNITTTLLLVPVGGYLAKFAEFVLKDKTDEEDDHITLKYIQNIKNINEDLVALEEKVDGDIANLTTHMSEAATALAEVDGRLDALEAFEETHASIEVSDIEGLFA